MATIGSYKGIPITGGTDAEVAAQVARVNQGQSAPASAPATNPAPATTPSSATADTSTSPSSTYYPRTGYTAPAETPLVAPTPQSVDEIQGAKTRAAQGQINALSSYYADLVREQQVINAKNDRSTAAISTLTGLAGSSEADVKQQETTKQGQQAIDKIKNEQAMQVQGILSKIREDAVTEARQQRLDYNASITDSITNRAKLAEMQTASLAAAGDHIKNLTAAGVTPDGLKSTDPQSYDYLLKQYGGDAAALKGAFLLNTPQDQILDKRVEGGKYIVARQNPITGKVTLDSIDLGLPPQYTKTIDAGNRILAVPDNWDGDPSKLISISKGLTPDQAAKNAGGGASSGYGGEFAATVDIISQKGGTNQQRAQIKQGLQSAIGAGDYGTAYQYVLNAAGQGLTAANRTKLENAAIDNSVLTDLKGSLQSLADSGYDTSLLTGTADEIQKKIGVLQTDPKYAAVAAQLDRTFQQYRQNMTGAAFGAKESAEYAKVLPSKSNTLALNLSLITGATDYNNSYVEGAIKSTVGQGGVYIKQYAEGATPATGSGTTPGEKVLVKDGQSFDAADLTPEEYQQAISDGYTPE